MTKHLIAIAFLVSLACLITGCGDDKPKLVMVTGKVVHKDKPLTAGNITLHPDAGNSFQKEKPSSMLQLDGSFTIKTFPYGDGVPPGKYKVTLSPELAGRIKQAKYSDPAKTPWTIDVPENGLSDHVLEVK